MAARGRGAVELQGMTVKPGPTTRTPGRLMMSAAAWRGRGEPRHPSPWRRIGRGAPTDLAEEPRDHRPFRRTQSQFTARSAQRFVGIRPINGSPITAGPAAWGRRRRRAARRRPIQEVPGLGLEGVQFFGPSGLCQVRVVAPPLQGAIEVGARLGDAAEPMIGPWPGRTGRRRRTRPCRPRGSSPGWRWPRQTGPRGTGRRPAC